MGRTTLTGRRGELVVDRELIPVHYLSDIDGAWRFTDAAGHEHYCVYEATAHWPTLTLVTDETYWCEECREEHELTHWACRQCGETIRPGTTGPGTKYLPGLITCTFNGEPITLERAMEIVATWEENNVAEARLQQQTVPMNDSSAVTEWAEVFRV